jgi:DNA-binding NtrC family response regulator
MIPLSVQPIKPRPQTQFSADQAVVPGRPTILLATVNPLIRQGMGDLLRGYKVNTRCATGIEEVRFALTEQDVLACFCGFWLIDGTYRDVVRLLKHHRTEIPMIIVCSPGCPQEYRDYLGALNIRACYFICHPYRAGDLERILNSAAALRNTPSRTPATATPTSDRSFETGLRRAS